MRFASFLKLKKGQSFVGVIIQCDLDEHGRKLEFQSVLWSEQADKALERATLARTEKTWGEMRDPSDTREAGIPTAGSSTTRALSRTRPTGIIN